MSTFVDPGNNDGRGWSIDGTALTHPTRPDAASRLVKLQAVKATEELLTDAGQCSSWSATGR